jgi:hypothetical protein
LALSLSYLAHFYLDVNNKENKRDINKKTLKFFVKWTEKIYPLLLLGQTTQNVLDLSYIEVTVEGVSR